MLKVGICDDERIFADIIRNSVAKIFNKAGMDVSVSTYVSSVTLASELSEKSFNALFLDIDMPVASGFDISRLVRETSPDTYIIFISSKHDLVYSSFEYNPFYFICKTDVATLQGELENVCGKLMQHYQQHRKLTIADPSWGKIVLRISDILYIKSEKHYLIYYPAGKVITYTERGSLAAKRDELGCGDFLVPHQRYLVNMRHIAKFGGNVNTVTMDNGDEIPLSKSCRAEALREFLKYSRR